MAPLGGSYADDRPHVHARVFLCVALLLMASPRPNTRIL